MGTKQSVKQVSENHLEASPKPDTVNQNVNISLSFKKPNFRNEKKENVGTKIDKYDYTYKKETDATIAAVTVFVIQIILYIIDIYEYANNPQNAIAIVALVNLLWRIIVTVWIVNISRRQNRDTTGWGIFAFILPNLALFIIGLLKKLNKYTSETKDDLLQEIVHQKVLQKQNEPSSETTNSLRIAEKEKSYYEESNIEENSKQPTKNSDDSAIFNTVVYIFIIFISILGFILMFYFS